MKGNSEAIHDLIASSTSIQILSDVLHAERKALPSPTPPKKNIARNIYNLNSSNS
jgi:hypothetical protein